MVTGQRVKAAMILRGITRVDHHDCGGCGEMVFFIRDGDLLFFNPGCGCSWAHREPREWDEAADWINMQDNIKVRAEIARRFGVDLSVPLPTEAQQKDILRDNLTALGLEG
jgi:hypothetical protein